MDRNRRARRVWILILVIVVLAAAAGLAWWKLFREVPQQLADGSVEEQFKYGSIGAEDDQGIPFWIWLLMPKLFPEYLPRPGGYAALGFLWERGHETPIGFSTKTIGFARVAINCAFCHTAAVRRAGEPTPRYYLGGPMHTADILAYERFLFACASDPRFNGDSFVKAIDQVYKLPEIDRLLYRYILVPQTRKALLEQKRQFAWTLSRPAWGRGRIDPFNPVKVATLGQGVGDTIGNSDMEPIWNLGPRVEHAMAFHWDGLNTDLDEVFHSSALGDGATPKSLPLAALARLKGWLMQVKPPRFQSLFPVDPALAAAGQPIYRQRCAGCHDFDGAQTGKVLPLTDEAWGLRQFPAAHRPLSTDPSRAQMWRPSDAAAYNDYAKGYPWSFSHFRSTGGYLNVPLDGVWIRAPYLHNGSVPSLADLLEPPERRVKVFYRGSDVYDPARMGFVAGGPEVEAKGFRFDTAQPGNSNQGHLWGTDLAPAEKRALIEYLKTL